MAAYSVFFLASTGSVLYTTRRGKFEEWACILDRLPSTAKLATAYGASTP